MLWAAWFYACLPPAYLSPIVSNYFGCFAPKNATLVSHFSPTLGDLAALGRVILRFFPSCLSLVYHLSCTLGALGRVILCVSPAGLLFVSRLSRIVSEHVFPLEDSAYFNLL